MFIWNGGPQAKLFCEIGSLEKREQDDCRMVTIDDGYVYIYKPSGKVQEERTEKRENNKYDKPKSISIKLLKKVTVAKVPLVLSSMRVNQAVSRGTFFEFTSLNGTYKGNRAAIQAVTQDWENNFTVDPLDCLSSIELETLVAKQFEENGCFVPAYKGGYLKDVDLFVTPDKNIEICGFPLLERETKNIQIKLAKLSSREIKEWLDKNEDNIFISLGDWNDDHVSSSPRVLTRKWLRSAIKAAPQTNEWLQRSLEWLPIDKRENT